LTLLTAPLTCSRAILFLRCRNSRLFIYFLEWQVKHEHLKNSDDTLRATEPADYPHGHCSAIRSQSTARSHRSASLSSGLREVRPTVRYQGEELSGGQIRLMRHLLDGAGSSRQMSVQIVQAPGRRLHHTHDNLLVIRRQSHDQMSQHILEGGQIGLHLNKLHFGGERRDRHGVAPAGRETAT
jgi:hypothetical protein